MRQNRHEKHAGEARGQAPRAGCERPALVAAFDHRRRSEVGFPELGKVRLSEIAALGERG